MSWLDDLRATLRVTSPSRRTADHQRMLVGLAEVSAVAADAIGEAELAAERAARAPARSVATATPYDPTVIERIETEYQTLLAELAELRERPRIAPRKGRPR